MTAMNLSDASVFTNLNGLNAINRVGKEDSPEALRAVAQQFEAMFLGMMLKGMRAGEDALFSDNFMNSNEMKFHRENMDQQVALHMATSGGVGLADALHRQMMERYIPDAARAADKPMSDDWRRRAVTAPVPEAASVRDIESPAGSPVSELPARFDSPAHFVETLMPMARKAAARLGADPRALIAQAALETGWGQKMITGADGKPSFNLFGIKSGGSWSGDAVSVSTLEFRDGVMQRESAGFRAYNSYQDSFDDYVQLLQGQPRYRQAVEHAAQPERFVHHLQEAGYATDPLYADKINRVMQSPVLDMASNGGSLSVEVNVR
jgi:peptidoglycan hydrolase FlgJ